MLRPEAIIFDFDGVLLESEYEGNVELAALLTELGFPHTVEESLRSYVGLGGRQFVAAIEARIGTSLPPAFAERRMEQSRRVREQGIAAVKGAVEFVTGLPAHLPKAVASSSSTSWMTAHLKHLALTDQFTPHLYSGREHVEHGKPAPDLYLYAADRLGVPIERTLIVEDSRIGVTGALASGAMVVGLAAGAHCFDGHADMLRESGVQHVVSSYGELRALIDLT